MFGYAGRHVPGIPTLADPHVLDDPTLGFEPEHPPGWTPPASIAAMSTPLISAPGQQASAEHFNYQPMGDGSWTMYPPGTQAPSWGPQGSFPDMASQEQLQGLGGALKQQFGGTTPSPGAAPSVEPTGGS